jgi:guanylate kinase
LNSNKDQGLLIVISGPSGAGKGTVCKLVCAANPDLRMSISETTRPPRGTEQDGVEYFFVTEESFQQSVEADKYLEHAGIYGKHYATPRKYVDDLRAQGRDVILEIDIQGAEQVRARCDDGIFIFIMPPSLEELKRRIAQRATETPEQIAVRMASAEHEMEEFVHYDYVVVNADKEVAAAEVAAILTAEKCRVAQQTATVKEILGR